MRALLIMIVVMGRAAGAAAQPAPPPTGDEAEAEAHYQRGKELYAAGKYGESIAEFRAALRTGPRPEMLYGIAQAQRKSGDCAGAIDSYHAFLAARPDDQLAGFAKANIERCEKELADAPPTPTPRPDPKPVRPPPPPARTERPSPWYRDWPGGLLTVGGLVVAGTGGALWLQGHGAASRLNSSGDYQSFVDRRAAASGALTLQRVGVAGMVVGGALIAGGVVRYLTRPGRRAPAVAVSPVPGGAAVIASGSF